jgi:futalosine hydrolase
MDRLRDRKITPDAENQAQVKAELQEPIGERWLICAATQGELDTFGEPGIGIALALTGVGIPCVLGAFQRLVQQTRPDRIVNIGIAGAYPNSGLEIGDIVLGESEVYGDVGFEMPEEPGFQSVREVAFGRDFYTSPFPVTAFPEFQHEGSFRFGRGCTVNACTGTECTGLLRERLFEAHFETMEGAAVAQIGQIYSIPVCEIRAISNKAACRAMHPENIALALKNLRHYLALCRNQWNHSSG